MSESVPSLCEIGRSLLEKTEILKKTLEMAEENKNNTGYLESFLNSESVQKIKNQVQDTAKDVMSKSLAENVENLKNNVAENLETVKGKAVATATEIKNNVAEKMADENKNNTGYLESFLNSESVQKIKNQVQDTAKDVMSKSLAENVENLKNNVAGNLESVKEKVQSAGNAAAEIKDGIMNKSLAENVGNLKNNVAENLEAVKGKVQTAAATASEIKNTVLSKENAEALKNNFENLKNKVEQTGADVKNYVTESETYKKVTELTEKDARKTIEEVTSHLQKQMTVNGFLQGPGKNSPPLGKSLTSKLYFLRDLIWIWLLSFYFFFKNIIGKFTKKEEKDLKDKVVVVTGAANGLGKEMAVQFAKLGCKVACVDVSYESNKETALSIMYATGRKDNVKSYGCDISKVEDVKKLAEDVVKDFGGVDILVNNAGVLYGHEILGGTDEMIQKVLDVNLAGNFWMVRSFLPIMRQKNSGHIVFIDSASGVISIGKAPSYSASKWGLLGLAYSLEDELRQNPENENIKLTTVLPYFVVTNPEFAKSWILRIPPMEVTEAVSQIISGIRRELFIFQVPGYELGYLVSNLMRMLPLELYRIIRNTLYVDIKLDDNGATRTSMEMRKST